MSVELKIGTANIKNFPDMTPEQVQQDMRKVASEGLDVIMWQEIQDKSDFMAIINAYGNEAFGTTSRVGDDGKQRAGTCITWRRALLKSMGPSKVTKIGPSMGPGTKAGSQYMAQMSYKVEGLPQIDIYCFHFIQGAFSKPGQAGDDDGRRLKAWQSDYAALKRAVLASHAAGHIAIFGGDWNRRGKDIPKVHKDHVWIVGGVSGIDHVGILLPPGVKLDAHGKTKNVNLNSDHHLRSRTISLEVAPAPEPRPQVAQHAIDGMAMARGYMESMGEVDSEWGKRAKAALPKLQDAINAFMGV